jgi:hypothetical protein
VLHLRPGIPDPGPPTREYASSLIFGQAQLAADTFEIPLWASKRRVVEDLRRFYAAPVES